MKKGCLTENESAGEMPNLVLILKPFSDRKLQGF